MVNPDPVVVPRAVRPGDTIAFLSPSGRLNETMAAPLARATALLESRGFRVRTIYQALPPTATVAASVAARKAELVAAFTDPEVAAIVCTSGGATATELLAALLHDAAAEAAIRAHPKVFVGYSDITVLHFFLAARVGLRTFYGPTAILELGEAPSPPDFTVSHLLAAIGSPSPPGPVPRSATYAPQLPAHFLSDDPSSDAPRPYAPAPAWSWLRGGQAEGRLAGGCHAVVVRLLGVGAVAPDWRGKILLLEQSPAAESMRRPFPLPHVRRALADLAAAGVFDHIAGLVFGRSHGYDSAEDRAALEALVREVLCPEEVVEEEGKKGGGGGGEEVDEGGEGRRGEGRRDEEEEGRGGGWMVCNERPFPILMHVDFGHTSPMLTLPLGALARLDSARDEFAILEAGVV